jgi:hypothetical protein
VAIAALDDSTLPPLIARLEEKVEELAAPFADWQDQEKPWESLGVDG